MTGLTGGTASAWSNYVVLVMNLTAAFNHVIQYSLQFRASKLQRVLNHMIAAVRFITKNSQQAVDLTDSESFELR